MRTYLNKIENKSIFLIAFSTAIFLLRTNIPYAIFIFSLLQFLLLGSLFLNTSFKKVFEELKATIKVFYLYYLIIVFFIIGLLVSPYTVETQGDIINLVMTISFLVLYYIKINTIKRFYLFRDYFVIIFTVLFGIYLLARFLFLLYNNEIGNFFFLVNNTEGFDRNSYSLNLWISIISVFWLIKGVVSKKWVVYSNIYVFFLLILVLFSSSRRGIILFVVFSVGFVIWQAYLFVNRKYKKNKYIVLLFLYISSFIVFFLTIIASPNVRNSLFDVTINDKIVKSKITQTLRRYYILEFPNTTHEQFEKIFWGTNAKTASFLPNGIIVSVGSTYKNRVDFVMYNWESIVNKDSLLDLLPELSKRLRSLITSKSVMFLPELLNRPYIYSNFFSYSNLVNINLVSYSIDNKNYPYEFRLNSDEGIVKLRLPALSNSSYKLKFRLESTENPINKLVLIDSTITHINYAMIDTERSGVYSFQSEFNTDIIKNGFIELYIELKKTDSNFKLSDLLWELNSNSNNNIEANVLQKMTHNLKRFKHEQKYYVYYWNQFYEAEKLINSDSMKWYSSKVISKLLNNHVILPKKYTNTKVVHLEDNDSIYFEGNTYFPRFVFNSPIVSKSLLYIDLDYYADTQEELSIFVNRSPEIGKNCFLYSKVIKDSITHINKHNYNRKVIVQVDSLNSAQFNIAFGYRNPNFDKVVVIKDCEFSMMLESDSVPLSIAQYNYLLKLYDNYNLKQNARVLIDSFTLLVNNESSKDFWMIDSAIYNYPMSDRLELWVFGVQYFKSLPWYKQLFGDGFNYYNIYTLKFGLRWIKYNKIKQYFPHNPILSSLLYSGIIGAIAYILFLLQVFYYYFKYRKDYGILLIIFVMVFLYSFVSNRSHFTDTFFIIFTLFPFVLHNIYSSKKVKELKV